MTKPSLLDKIETFRGAAGAAKERGRGLKHFINTIYLRVLFYGPQFWNIHMYETFFCISNFLSHYFYYNSY